MNNKELKELVEFGSSIPAKMFVIHRLVSGDLWRKYDLNGYEIDFLVFTLSLAEYKIGNVVKGKDIRAKASRRFGNVMRPIANKLVSMGFLEYLTPPAHQKEFKMGITDKGLEFANSWRESVNKHLYNEGVLFILNVRFSWERIDKE